MNATKTPNRLAGLMLIAAMAATAAARAQAPPTPVRTDTVTTERVQEHRRVTGSLQAVARSSVASQEAGQVVSVETDEGRRVHKGDVIARLDDRRLAAQLAEALARVNRAESNLAERKSELAFAEFENRRLENLRRGLDASERESKEAETQLSAAAARVEAAQRAIIEGQRQADLLKIRLDDMTVRAPYDARVVARHVDAGEWIEPGEPIVTLVSTGTIEARLEVPERFAAPVAQYADRIYADVIGVGQTIPSTDVRVIPDVDPKARSFRVVLTLDNPNDTMAPGMSVTAWIPTTDEAEHLTVPKSAVVRSGRDAYVYRSTNATDGQATAAKTPVTVLFDWQDRVVVAADQLRAGDRVIVEGNERIVPGNALALGDAK